MVQPSRISGSSSGSVSKEIALECWPPAVLAMRLAQRRLDEVEGGRADADQRHGRGIDQREQAAEAEADAPRRPCGRPRARGRRPRARGRPGPACPRREMSASGACVLALAVRIAPDGVVAGIGLDAAAPAAAAQRAVGPVDHVAELAARRLRAGEQLALQHQAHADAVRQQDGDEVVAVALRACASAAPPRSCCSRSRRWPGCRVAASRRSAKSRCRVVRRDRRPQHRARARHR